MKIQIAGGGIGGLTAAIALGKKGHSVSLVEKSPEFAPVGAGIILAANSIAILRFLGVDLSDGFPIHTLDVLDSRSRLLSGFPVRKMGWEVLSFHRAELHKALVKALPASVQVQLGTEWQEDADADLVIGADGLRSVVRSQRVGEAVFRYSGETCWRAVVPDCRVDRVTETWGVGMRMGIVPLTDYRVYGFLTSVSPPDAATPPWEQMSARYAALGGDCPMVIGKMNAEMLIHHDLRELEAPLWGKDKYWLLGDAAHGMTPNQGQGASMAIEDAVVLTRIVTQGGTLSDYVAARHNRVRKIQLDSRRFGQVASWTNPLARWARDLLLRSTPLSTTATMYRDLVEPGIALANY